MLPEQPARIARIRDYLRPSSCPSRGSGPEDRSLAARSGGNEYFDQPDFRVRKKIFATLHAAEKRAVVKLGPEEQAMLVESEPKVLRCAGRLGPQGLDAWIRIGKCCYRPGGDDARLAKRRAEDAGEGVRRGLTPREEGIMELKTIRYDIADGIATVMLSRPKRRNAWTGRMHTEYRHVLERADNDPAVRVIVVTGDPEGNAFCAGADLGALEGHSEKGRYDAEFPTISQSRALESRPNSTQPSPIISA